MFSNLFTDLPGTANTGTPLASFLLGQVQLFTIDLQQNEIWNRAHFEECSSRTTGGSQTAGR